VSLTGLNVIAAVGDRGQAKPPWAPLEILAAVRLSCRIEGRRNGGRSRDISMVRVAPMMEDRVWNRCGGGIGR
jgi:hypothetical protein